jgi:hypothetical protein
MLQHNRLRRRATGYKPLGLRQSRETCYCAPIQLAFVGVGWIYIEYRMTAFQCRLRAVPKAGVDFHLPSSFWKPMAFGGQIRPFRSHSFISLLHSSFSHISGLSTIFLSIASRGRRHKESDLTVQLCTRFASEHYPGGLLHLLLSLHH